MTAWGVLAAGVVVIDAAAIRLHRRTLSEEYAAAARTSPLVLTLGTAALLAHLLGAIPRRIDPLCVAAGWLRAHTAEENPCSP